MEGSVTEAPLLAQEALRDRHQDSTRGEDDLHSSLGIFSCCNWKGHTG